MRILFFNRWVGYNEGGNETHIKELAQIMSTRGHHVGIMTTGREKLQPYSENLSIYEVPGPRSYLSSIRGGSILGAVFLMGAFIRFLALFSRGVRYDVVSVHFSLEAFLMRFIHALFGTPYVFVFAGDTTPELVEGRWADLQIQISNYMARECAAFGYVPIVIPKGIDLTRFNTGVDGSEIRRQFCKENERLVLTVCRLEPRKDIPTLLSAAQMVCRTYPNVVFVIVGDGVERRRIEQNIKLLELGDRVVLVGSVPYSDNRLPKFYRGSDVFVLPTLYEGFGWVFMEAMACGVPIISTSVGSNPEVVSDCGILVPPKRGDLLADAIVSVLGNRELSVSLREKGLAKVQCYSWEHLIVRYEEALASMRMSKSPLGRRLRDLIESLIDDAPVLAKFMLYSSRSARYRWGPWLPAHSLTHSPQ